MKFYRAAWVLVVVILSSGAGSALGQSPEEPFRLKVALYPWVPNAESLVDWIERDFESRNPDIDLVVRPLARAMTKKCLGICHTTTRRLRQR